MSFNRTIIVLLVLLHTGCGADKRAVPEIARDLSSPAKQQGVRLELAEITLESHEDFDRFESQVLSKMSLKNALDVYEALADKKRTGKARNDALLLSRRVIFIFEAANRATEEAEKTSLLKRGLELKEKLRREFPNDPHTLYSEGYVLLRLYQIYGMHYRSRAQSPGNQDIGQQSASQLKKLWSRLLELAPTYIGPRKYNADRIRRELSRLEILSKDGGIDRGAQSSIRSASSENLTLARESLWSLENKPQQARSICRDYQKSITGKAGLALPASFAEAEIGLKCGVLLENRELALAGLGQLIVRGARPDVCHELEAIRCRTNSRACAKLRQLLSSASVKDDLCTTAGFFSAQALLVLRALNSVKTAQNSEQNKSIDVTEKNQRIRRHVGPDGAIIAQAVARRGADVDGITPSTAIRDALNRVMESDTTRQQLLKAVSNLLGKEEAVASSFKDGHFDGVKGHLLHLKGLKTNSSKEARDLSFFVSQAASSDETTTWVTSALAVVFDLKNRPEVETWATPSFPEQPKVAPPTLPSSDLKPSPDSKSPQLLVPKQPDTGQGQQAPTQPGKEAPTPDKPVLK